MRAKTLLILAGVLVGLGILSLVRYWVQRSRGPDLPLKGVPADAIVKIEIRQPAQTVTLERISNHWELNAPVTAPADESAVKPLLEGLTKLTVGAVLSSRPERHTQFQVTEASGTTVQVWTRVSTKPARTPPPSFDPSARLKAQGKLRTSGMAEGPHAAFIIGKSAPEGTGVYLRYQGTNEVHLAEGVAPYLLNRAVKDWRDKTILRVNIADIERVQFTHSPSGLKAGPSAALRGGSRGKGSETFSLVKTSDTWRVVGKIPLPPPLSKGEVSGPSDRKPQQGEVPPLQGKAPGTDTTQAGTDKTSERGQPADAGKVDALLATLAALDADDFIDPPQANDLASLGLSPPALTVHVKTKTQEVTLTLGIPQPSSSSPPPALSPSTPRLRSGQAALGINAVEGPTPSGTPLRKDTASQIFLISNDKAEALNKTLADILTKPPA